MQEKVDVLPFLALFRTYNTGVAFSMFASIGDLGLIAISAAVILFVLYLAVAHGARPGHRADRLRADHRRRARQHHRPRCSSVT